MANELFSLPPNTRNFLRVDAPRGFKRVFSFGGTLYYGTNPHLDSTNADGSISTGGNHQFTDNIYLFASGYCRVVVVDEPDNPEREIDPMARLRTTLDVRFLNGVAGIGSTTIRFDRPAIGGPKQGFVVIDPFEPAKTEVRRVTGSGGTTIVLDTATEVAHPDGAMVFYLWGSTIPVSWFGPAGDDTTDDEVALQRAIDQSAPYQLTLDFEMGSHRIGLPLMLPTQTRLVRNNALHPMASFSPLDVGDEGNYMCIGMQGSRRPVTSGDAANDTVTITTSGMSQSNHVVFKGSSLPGGVVAGRMYTVVGVSGSAHTLADLRHSGRDALIDSVGVTTNRITLPAHGWVTGQKVAMVSAATPGGLVSHTVYYVLNEDTDSFRLAATDGGSAIDITSEGFNIVMAPVLNITSDGTGTAYCLAYGTNRIIVDDFRIDGLSVIGTYATTTGAIDATTTELNLDAPVRNVTPGMYVAVAGSGLAAFSTVKAIDATRTKLTLYNAAANTVSAAAVTFSAKINGLLQSSLQPQQQGKLRIDNCGVALHQRGQQAKLTNYESIGCQTGLLTDSMSFLYCDTFDVEQLVAGGQVWRAQTSYGSPQFGGVGGGEIIFNEVHIEAVSSGITAFDIGAPVNNALIGNVHGTIGGDRILWIHVGQGVASGPILVENYRNPGSSSSLLFVQDDDRGVSFASWDDLHESVTEYEAVKIISPTAPADQAPHLITGPNGRRIGYGAGALATPSFFEDAGVLDTVPQHVWRGWKPAVAFTGSASGETFTAAAHGLVEGQAIITQPSLPASFVATAADDLLTRVAHGLTEDQIVQVTASPPTGLSLHVNYYVHVHTVDSITLRLAPGGSDIDLRSDQAGVQIAPWLPTPLVPYSVYYVRNPLTNTFQVALTPSLNGAAAPIVNFKYDGQGFFNARTRRSGVKNGRPMWQGDGTTPAAGDAAANEMLAFWDNTVDSPLPKWVGKDSAGTAFTGTFANALWVPNTKTGDYTLVLSDAGKAVEVNSASNFTVTIPPNSSVAFPIGTRIVVSRIGAGTVTLAAGAGVTLRSPAGAVGLTAQYSTAELRKRAADEWVASGSLT